MKWMYYPDPKLHLTLRQLQLLRHHLFGDAAATLSDRLSDVELVQLLIVSAGRSNPVALHHSRTLCGGQSGCMVIADPMTARHPICSTLRLCRWAVERV